MFISTLGVQRESVTYPWAIYHQTVASIMCIKFQHFENSHLKYPPLIPMIYLSIRTYVILEIPGEQTLRTKKVAIFEHFWNSLTCFLRLVYTRLTRLLCSHLLVCVGLMFV